MNLHRMVFPLAALLLAGCGPRGNVAAVVNGHVITSKEVDERMARMGPSARASLGNDRRRAVEQMVNEAILFREAGQRGLDRDAEVKRLLQEARHQIMIGRLLEMVREESGGKVSEEEIAHFYEANRGSFSQPESWRASHILVSDPATAEKALERLKKKEPFDRVAQELSTDPSKTRGGDIGFFISGQVIPEFEAACRSLKPGEMSKVVKSSLGYHVIWLTEQRPARERTLEEVRSQITQMLQNQKSQQKMETFLTTLRSKSQVKVHESTSLVPSTVPGRDAGTATP